MGYNRYRGSSGMVEYVETPREGSAPPPPSPAFRGSPPSPPGGILPAGLSDALSRAFLGNLETEDLLVAAILYLAYRSSGDMELLIAMGAYLLL